MNTDAHRDLDEFDIAARLVVDSDGEISVLSALREVKRMKRMGELELGQTKVR